VRGQWSVRKAEAFLVRGKLSIQLLAACLARQGCQVLLLNSRGLGFSEANLPLNQRTSFNLQFPIEASCQGAGSSCSNISKNMFPNPMHCQFQSNLAK
jgi:hypothetical protein